MSKKKIITLATRSGVGGAQINAHMLACEFLLRGYDAEVWYLMRSGDFDHGHKVSVRFFLPHVTKNPVKLAVMFFLFFKAVFKTRPGVILGFHPLANILGALAKLFGFVDRFYATQRNPASSQSRVTGFVERVLGSTSIYSGNIAVSQSVRATFASYPDCYKAKFSVVHNGLPLLPKINEPLHSLRDYLGIPQNSFVIGFLGRLAEQKNVTFLLDLMPKLPSAVLALAGDGPLKGSLLNKAKALGVEERVIFCGELHGLDISRFFSAINIFVLPSHFEGFGRTLVEAMQFGLPIVANDLEVTREVLGEAAVLRGLVHEDWLETINLLQADEALCSSFAEKSVERAGIFCVPAMVDGYLNVILTEDKRR